MKKVKEILFGYMDIHSMPVYVLEDGTKMLPIERYGHLAYITEEEYLKEKAKAKK